MRGPFWSFIRWNGEVMSVMTVLDSQQESRCLGWRGQLVLLACAWGVGGVLTFAALGHLANPVFFLGNVVQYDLVSLPFARLVAAALPWIELSLGAMLIMGVYRKTAFSVAGLLFILFVIAQSIALIRGLDIDCGCFGALVERPVGSGSLGLAAGMFCAAMLGRTCMPKHAD